MQLDRLIVGLGNPGGEYEKTPHNVGFDVVRLLAERYGARLDEQPMQCQSRFCSFQVETAPAAGTAESAEVVGTAADPGALSDDEEPQPKRIGLAQPLTFMNRSGLAVRCLVEEYSLDPWQLLIVYDEVSLPLGELRLRPKGSPGGHRGMESVVYNLRTANLARLRCGVGPCPDEQSLTDYVLAPFPQKAEKAASELTSLAADCVESWWAVGSPATMNRFNGRQAGEASVGS